MSAFIVSRKHISYMIRAALEYSYTPNTFRWYVKERKASDYQRGEPWGPTHPESVKDRERTLASYNRDEIGDMLMIENHRSVNHRYDSHDPASEFTYDRSADRLPLNAAAVIKAVHCYEYQACEHPEWEDSDAKAFCDALVREATRKIPGYEDAPWEYKS